MNYMSSKPVVLGLSVLSILLALVLIQASSTELQANSLDNPLSDYHDSRAFGGDPVDLATGLYYFNENDIVTFEQPPIKLTRTYRNRDQVSRAFGIGATHPYEIFLVGDGNRFTYVELILADGGRIRFERVSPGISYSDAIFEHTATPTEFYRARLAWDRGGWTIKLTNGASYSFLECNDTSVCSLVRYTDPQGKKIEIKRDTQGRAQAIILPSGNRITLDADSKGRIKSAEYWQFPIIQRCYYEYDMRGRLIRVRRHLAMVEQTEDIETSYAYDDLDQIQRVNWTDVSMVNDYDEGGHIIRQTISNGKIFKFRYVLDNQSRIIQTDVWEPDRTLRRVTFNAQGYTLTDAIGLLTERMISYRRESPGNRIVAVSIWCYTKKGLLQTEEQIHVGEDSDNIVERLKKRCTQKKPPHKFDLSDFAFDVHR